MNVGELKKLLERYENNLEVVVYMSDSIDFIKVSRVEKTKGLSQDDGTYFPREEWQLESDIYEDDDKSKIVDVLLID